MLARRADPALVARGVRFITASLDDASAVAAACAGHATVFHTAAKVGVWGRYADFFRTNVLGTRAILAGCRAHGVARLVYTSTPSVVYNGQALANADESLPLATSCPSPYPLTKAIAEREVLAANSAPPSGLRTVALRPHLIWGVGDPHLVPRVLARARAGRLRIIGDGTNRVDMVHVANAVDAHLAAEQTLSSSQPSTACGRPYFITNGEPVLLWEWINQLLTALGEPPVTRRLSLSTAFALGAVCETLWINQLLTALGEPPVTRRLSLSTAFALGAVCETLWRVLPVTTEPPMTRFIAAELAKDHWFNLAAARRDLGYEPRVSMAAGTAELIASLRV